MLPYRTVSSSPVALTESGAFIRSAKAAEAAWEAFLPAVQRMSFVRLGCVSCRTSGGILNEGKGGMEILVFVVGSMKLPSVPNGASASCEGVHTVTFSEEPMSTVRRGCG